MKKIIAKLPILLLLALLSGCGYNTMQANEEAVAEAWGNVESSYQRRADLVPNLVRWSKGMPSTRPIRSRRSRGPRQGRFHAGRQDVLNNPTA